MAEHKIRKVRTDGTASYQLGRYEMSGAPGKRRSAFKVEVHLGEYATAEEALSEWPRQIARLREIGRERKAQTLETKLNRLVQITKGEDDG